MLTYHPMHDPSHCTFRLLCLLKDINMDEVYWDLLKILDFYILFPHLLSKIKLPVELKPHRLTLNKVKPPYEHLPPATRLMFELGEIQEQTIKSMIAKGLIECDSFLAGKIKLRPVTVPKPILNAIQSEKFRKESWYNFLTKFLSKLSIKGNDGLKARTGLMEYRYDIV